MVKVDLHAGADIVISGPLAGQLQKSSGWSLVRMGTQKNGRYGGLSRIEKATGRKAHLCNQARKAGRGASFLQAMNQCSSQASHQVERSLSLTPLMPWIQGAWESLSVLGLSGQPHGRGAKNQFTLSARRVLWKAPRRPHNEPKENKPALAWQPPPPGCVISCCHC